MTVRDKIKQLHQDRPAGTQDFLEGQLLIAMPTMSDPRFEKSVVYLCAHSPQGAMGFIINKAVDHLSFADLLDQFDIKPANNAIELPVHLGGPVDSSRGFVLHSDDYYREESTLCDCNGVGLTATLDVLKAIASGRGPRRSLLALGYAGWGPGQLESEIRANGWLYCPADIDLMFHHHNEMKWQAAIHAAGVDLSFLSSEMGQA